MSEDENFAGDLGEDALVGRLVALLGGDGARIRVGPGDDCAVLDAARPKGFPLLLKTDAVMEGSHFEPDEDPARVGRKAICRALSDLAAMGGEPLAALVTLAAPREMPVARLEGIYEGLAATARTFDAPVVGGETTSLPDGAPLFLSVAMLGEVREGDPILRSGGQAGDLLYVSGLLGGSLASGRHLDFEPRIKEGRWLARHGFARAMMDLSDGLAADLPRLAASSQCGFRVSETLPANEGVGQREAAGDGEDYELLMAVDSECVETLERGWAQSFPSTSLTRIGALTDGEVDVPESLGFATGGWDTFRDAAR